MLVTLKKMVSISIVPIDILVNLSLVMLAKESLMNVINRCIMEIETKRMKDGKPFKKKVKKWMSDTSEQNNQN